MRDKATFARDQAMAIVQINPKAAVEAMEDYRKALFPWASKSEDKEKGDHVKSLMAEIGMGPLVITEQRTKPISSRMKAKVIDVSDVREKNERVGQFYAKLGKVIPH